MLTRDSLRDIRADMDKVLQEVAKRHGLSKLIAGHASFDPHAGFFTMKVEGTAAGGITKEAARYNELRNFTPNLPEVGDVTRVGGKLYIIRGCNTTGTKVLGELEGKRYLLTVPSVQRAVLAARPPL